MIFLVLIDDGVCAYMFAMFASVFPNVCLLVCKHSYNLLCTRLYSFDVYVGVCLLFLVVRVFLQIFCLYISDSLCVCLQACFHFRGV